MGQNFLTNVLLAVIATLLFVLVIQNTLYHPSRFMTPNFTEAPPPPNPLVVNKPGTPMGGSMYFEAVRAFPKGCEKFSTLSQCSNSEAEAVKAQISEWENSGMPPRQVFDQIIAKYGEKALTEQALKIRSQRRRESGSH